MQVIERRRGGVAELWFENRPVNAISVGAGLVDALDAAVARAVADPEVDRIVLVGANGLFSAGADIRDFESDLARLDALRALFRRIEDSPKPIVAAIEGLCLGGGLELALAAHYRVARPSATFGLPEVTLGLLPGGGGTQRLPRLVGAPEAIEMMLSGKPVGTVKARESGLIDDVVEEDLIDGVHAWIGAGNAATPRRSGACPVPADLGDAIAAARPKARGLAAVRILDCVEAICARDFAAGLTLEANVFAELAMSESSLALRHGFFGRRQAASIPGAAKIAARPICSVTVVGGGLMGTGIAIALANAKLRVIIVEPRAEARDRACGAVASSIRRDFEKGRITAEDADARIAAVTAVATIEEAAGADLFIEAVFEDMAVKRDVFTALDRVAGPEAILASNTSTLDLDAIATFTSRSERVVGLHFFSPANVMRLLEVVRGAQTSAETLASAMAFAKAIGKTGVVAGVCDGFIGNRIFEEYLRQAWFLLEEGALPQQIDRALETWGMAMGPCRVMDLAGQDIGWNIRKRRAVEQPDRPYSSIPDRVCELGRFGQKTGAGFYRYPDGRTPEPDPEIEALILAESARIGLARRPIDDREILERCIYAMVNEGAKVVGEGVAYGPVDVDIVYLDGYGFPAERGGPMFFADRQGLPRVLDAIRGYAAGRHGWAWEPAPLLVDLVARGASFGSVAR